MPLALRTHQINLIAEMLRLERLPHRTTNGGNLGVLCEKAGSGKSLAVLGLITADKTVPVSDARNRCFA